MCLPKHFPYGVWRSTRVRLSVITQHKRTHMACAVRCGATASQPASKCEHAKPTSRILYAHAHAHTPEHLDRTRHGDQQQQQQQQLRRTRAPTHTIARRHRAALSSESILHFMVLGDNNIIAPNANAKTTHTRCVRRVGMMSEEMIPKSGLHASTSTCAACDAQPGNNRWQTER